MKILFINHFPLEGSGSGVYTANLAKSLKRRGHETAIIFSENRKEYGRYEGVKLYPLYFNNTSEAGEAEQADYNFPCFTSHPLSKNRFRTLTEDVKKDYEERYCRHIKAIIEEFKPDVLHSQHLWVLSGIAARCCKEKGIPLVVTCHGTDLMGIADEIEDDVFWGRGFVNEAVEYAYQIITISRSNDDDMKMLVPDAIPKTRLIANGVDSNVFYRDNTVDRSEVLRSLGIEKNFEHVVSFVGRLAAMKRVHILLHAAKIYENGSIATLIAGDGDMREELEQMAKDLELKNVYFLGNQPHNVLHNIYNAADCSVIQSKKEPFGLVALEALACGTPVVATNQGGLTDFVTPDKGILFEVDDYEAMAEGISKIISGEVKFDGEKISKEIRDNYSQDVIITKFEDLYKESMK